MHDSTRHRQMFRSLHERGCFVIPNPWDRGSAIYLASLGFRALASSSAGLAFTLGLPDSPRALTKEIVLDHLRMLVQATELPVNADFQSGYASDAEGVARNVKECVHTGVAGLSIEDASGDPERALFDLDVAVERVRAARRAIDETGCDVLLTARAECYLVAQPDPLAESIRRLRAYSEAGADVLFAPGVREQAEIRALVAAVQPKPFNLLVGTPIGLSLPELAALGVRRVSVGSALARTGWTAFANTARAIASEGDFSGFDGIIGGRELNRLFLT